MNIHTKYDIDDEVWSLVSHKAESHKVNAIKLSVNYHGDRKIQIKYRLRGGGEDVQTKQWWVAEDHLFPTKELLLASL